MYLVAETPSSENDVVVADYIYNNPNQVLSSLTWPTVILTEKADRLTTTSKFDYDGTEHLPDFEALLEEVATDLVDRIE